MCSFPIEKSPFFDNRNIYTFSHRFKGLNCRVHIAHEQKKSIYTGTQEAIVSPVLASPTSMELLNTLRLVNIRDRKQKRFKNNLEFSLFLEYLRLFAEWLIYIQYHMKNLRLGIMCLSLWETCKTSYIQNVNSMLILGMVSRRMHYPANMLYRHFEKHISWRRHCKNNGNEQSPDEKHEVKCKVDVVSWRERFISATINVEVDINRVWEVLTDYELLAEFVPNLIHSARISCPYPGRIWLLQRGLHTAMYWHIEATVVLDLEEFSSSKDEKSLQFCMVDGDFKKYAGRWLLKPGTRPGTTDLQYEVNVIPRLLLPGVFVERIIEKDLPINLRAIAERAEQNHRSVVKLPAEDVKLPVATPVSSIVSKVVQTSETKVQSFVQTNDKIYAEKWDNEAVTRVKKVCKSEKSCTVDEVHLRRLSEEDKGFWRVVSGITIAASVDDVWSVLRDYESLSEFTPNLSSSKILSRDGNRVRILQEGCKCLLYMVLHARVVLDLHEFPTNEIAFEQVEGDFEIFKGKWTLESLGTEHTLLKYTVDMKMQNDFLLPREIIEEVVYEDLPENLCAIRARVELGESCYVEKSTDETNTKPCIEVAPTQDDGKPIKRKSIPGLQKDINILERELKKFINKCGKEGVMPMRGELREHGRVDLEKAISKFGGFNAIAQRFNVNLSYKQRKPRGYWDEFDNLKREIWLFQKKNSVDPTYMPSKRTLERAGRYDVARALEKWGGVHEVANILNLRTKKKRLTEEHEEELGWEDWKPGSYQENIPSDNSKTPVKTSLPEAPTKWLKVD